MFIQQHVGESFYDGLECGQNTVGVRGDAFQEGSSRMMFQTARGLMCREFYQWSHKAGADREA